LEHSKQNPRGYFSINKEKTKQKKKKKKEEMAENVDNINPLEQLLADFGREYNQDLPGGVNERKLQARQSGTWEGVINQQKSKLTFPLVCIYRAIGVRPSARELKQRAPGTDSSRKRGEFKYFRCIVYYKGDYAEKCVFTNNISRRCNMFVQFFENPSDFLDQPPSETLIRENGWDPSNNGWGKKRPVLHSNARAAASEVVQNYEHNLITAPRGPYSTMVPSNAPYPDERDWKDAFAFLGPQGREYQWEALMQRAEAPEQEPPPYEWKDLKDSRSRLAYQLRPDTNLVTNTGLHLFFVEGTGGKQFLDYTQGEVHPILQPHLKEYIRELQRLSFLSDRAHRIRVELLRQQKLPYMPLPIRRFRFGDESKRVDPRLDRDESYFPIFPQCSRGMGLIDADTARDRFEQANFSYPSIEPLPDFLQVLKLAQRQNILNAQVPSEEAYLENPLFRSQIARERFRDSAHRWSKNADRILRRNQNNSRGLNNLIDQLRSMPVGYGAINF
jgi:hypothetical protein